MYFQLQTAVALIRDAANLGSLYGGFVPASSAGLALLAGRYPERLRRLAPSLDLAHASESLADALRSGEAAGHEAARWLPEAQSWLEASLRRA